LKHIETIQKFVHTLMVSRKMHALVVVSPPGWGKSSTIDDALKANNIKYHAVGSYTTPLALYHALCQHRSKLILLDDCAGVFNDAKAMSLLKAATWSSAGVDGKRQVTWDSTSDRVEQREVTFEGKLILLANILPSRQEVQTFLSRAFVQHISFTDDEAKAHLLYAAKVERYFPKTDLAVEVASFLVNNVFDRARDEMSLRTLHQGYEIAESHPNEWRELLTALFLEKQQASDPERLVRELAMAEGSVRKQLQRFQELTGLSRRTFFNYRRKQGVVGAQE